MTPCIAGWMKMIELRLNYERNWGIESYLIFVTSINSGASVKKLTEGNFFPTIKAKRTPDSYFTHNV